MLYRGRVINSWAPGGVRHLPLLWKLKEIKTERTRKILQMLMKIKLLCLFFSQNISRCPWKKKIHECIL
jgi:hypothetical protein